jgi:sulfofructose kinase
VGHVAVDLLFEVDTMPSRPVKTPAHRHRQTVGGMTANACVAAARLGAEVTLASPVGDDTWAAVFERHLQAEGVRPSGLVRVAGEGSSVSAIVIDARGERMIVNCRGSALQAAPEWDSVPALAALDAAVVAGGRRRDGPLAFDAVLVDPRCPAWAEHALRTAREAGALSVFDADVAPVADLQRLVGLARWAVFSLPGLQAFTGRTPGEPWSPPATPQGGVTSPAIADDPWLRDGLAQALAAGAEVAVVTLGEWGLVWSSCDNTLFVQDSPQDPPQGLHQDLPQGRRAVDPPLAHVPAPVMGPVVDTLAAGDVFHGALAVALAEGQPASDALRFASAAAALKCLKPGGVLGAPDRPAVDGLLAQQALEAECPSGFHPMPTNRP